MALVAARFKDFAPLARVQRLAGVELRSKKWRQSRICGFPWESRRAGVGATRHPDASRRRSAHLTLRTSEGPSFLVGSHGPRGNQFLAGIIKRRCPTAPYDLRHAARNLSSLRQTKGGSCE